MSLPVTEHGLDDYDVALAVVVERWLNAIAAGVMFTAHPISWPAKDAVVDAAPGLRAACRRLPGAVDPDYHGVRRLGGRITEGVRQNKAHPVLVDALVMELVKIGRRIEHRLGHPQDVSSLSDRDERALRSSRRVRSQPVPAARRGPIEGAGVLLDEHRARGISRRSPRWGWKCSSPSSGACGATFADDRTSPTIARSPVVVAGGVPFVNVTACCGTRSDGLPRRVSAIERGAESVVFTKFGRDPRFAASRRRRAGSLRRILPGRPAVETSRCRLLAVMACRRIGTVDDLIRNVERGHASRRRPARPPFQRLDAVERVHAGHSAVRLPRLLPAVVAAMLVYHGGGPLLGGRAPSRGAHEAEPWDCRTGPDHRDGPRALGTDEHVEADAASRQVAAASRIKLVFTEAYRMGQVQAVLQTGLSAFLDRYGFRSSARSTSGWRAGLRTPRIFWV